MQKYMHLQVNFLQLVLVEIILWCDSAGDTVTHCSPKRAYGFHGTPSKFHCLSSIPLILAYNVYSQVNWTGTSLWLWRSLLRGSEAVLLPKRKTSTASERGAAVLPVTVHEWLCDRGIWKKGLLRVYFQSWWCLYDEDKVTNYPRSIYFLQVKLCRGKNLKICSLKSVCVINKVVSIPPFCTCMDSDSGGRSIGLHIFKVK